MKAKTQILIVHGGMTFKNRKDYLNFLKNREISIAKKIKWSSDYLDKELGKNFEIIRPRMPLQDDAKYGDWKIYFERIISYLKDDMILIGESLGGIFLAKYLSENKFPKKILSTYLVCPPFDNTLTGEDLVGGFKLKSDLSLLENNSKNLYLLFSEDDDVVPAPHAKKYGEKLKNAKIVIYKSKNGHFKIPKFPEIIEMIKGDVK
ncbi:alpha/beta hydrolase [Patescibacteria group bacterium]|nr:alpha/beta hydrolase [Patescibacteria group bacterium]